MDMTLSIQKAAFQDRNEDMGVTVPLSAEVANQLRLHHHRSREQQQPPTTTTITDPQLTVLSSLSLSSNRQIHAVESSEQENDSDYEPSAAQMTSSLVDPLDDWNEVLPVDNVPRERDDEVEEEEGEDNDDEEEEPETHEAANHNNNDDSDDDELSLSPPPHMPVVLVELQRLVGYTPSTQEEREDLTHQIQTAMWHGSVQAASHKAGGNPQEDYFNVPQILDAAQHFEERVAELMKSGVALHSTTNTTDTASSNHESDGNNDGDENEKETSFIVTTTASVKNSQKYAVIAYPEYLCTPSTIRNNTDDDDDDETATKEFIPPRRQVVLTAQIWKRLLRSHPIPVVNSLLDHVRNCHRTLLWKHAMHLELQQLATTEERARIRRHQTSALKQWKMVKRQAQLEQLYHVRETLEHRYEMARAKVQDQLDRRDQTVKIELLKRRMQAFDTNTNSDVGGLEALDLNSTILAFPDNAMNGWLGLEGEDNDDYDDQVGPSFVSDGSDDDEHYDGGEESDSSGYDAERDIDDKSQEGVTAAPPTATAPPTPTLDLDSGVLSTSNNALNPTATTSTTQTFPKRDTKARREALAKKRRRRLEEAAKEAEHQAKLDKAMAEEARMREMMTTTDLKMSQAIAAALEKKLESVDNLLESLQDEAWADEEAQENGKIILPEDEEDLGGETSSSNDNELTLLDQVLAMILGTYPPPAPTNREDPANVLARHTLQLQAEHARIVKEWKAHFGRLPPPLAIEKSEQEEEQTSIKHPPKSKGKSQTELRSSFGIVENEYNDWENADSEDDGGNGGVDGSVVSISSSPGNTQRTAVPAPSSRPPTVGLRPGGRAKK